MYLVKKCGLTDEKVFKRCLKQRNRYLHINKTNEICIALIFFPSFFFCFLSRYVYRQEPEPNDLAVNQSLQILFYFFFAINPIFPFCVSKKFRRNASILLRNGCSVDLSMRQIRPPSLTLQESDLRRMFRQSLAIRWRHTTRWFLK